MTRERLPDRRHAERIRFNFDPTGKADGFRCLATIGRACEIDVPNALLKFGDIKEVFIDVEGMKSGSDFLAAARDGGLMISIALQAGITLETLAESLSRRQDGSAAGVMGAAIDAIIKHYSTKDDPEPAPVQSPSSPPPLAGAVAA